MMHTTLEVYLHVGFSVSNDWGTTKWMYSRPLIRTSQEHVLPQLHGVRYDVVHTPLGTSRLPRLARVGRQRARAYALCGGVVPGI